MDSHHMVEGENSLKEYIKLFLVLAGITLLSWLLYRTFDAGAAAGLGDWLRWFMGVFFLVFASFKLIGYEMFTMMFAGYDIVAKRVKAYAYAYPFIELGLGTAYVFDLLPAARDLLTVLVMGIGTIGVVQEIKKRSGVHCACLGNIIKLPLSTVSLIEDAGMGLMALFMLLKY